jgi:5'-nucleotidase
MSHLRPVAAVTAIIVALGLSTLTAAPASAVDATTTIAEVQGTGESTPISGSVVTVHGVITADLTAPTGSGYRGVFVQDPNAGAVAEASDGIFVYTANHDPAGEVGDLVSITGTAGEYQGQTQITIADVAGIEVLTPGAGLPAATVLPDGVVGAAREAFEGMLVAPESAYLTSSHQLYNYGTLWMSTGGMQVKATETADAGDAANAIAAANAASRLLVDDGYSLQISNGAHPGDQPFFETATVVRNGDRYVGPSAGMVLSWGFGDWRLQPQRPLSSTSPAEYAAYEPTWESLNPRTDAPAEVGGDFSIAAFNVFNYFTTFGGDARGADTPEQFAIQQSKIVAAILDLDADVVALQEIENSLKLGEPVDEAIADLVGALNAVAGAGTWDYVPTPPELTDPAIVDVITNGIIYRTATATPVGGSFADVDETVWDIAREPLAQTFDIDGKVVTVVANHFKSKSPPEGNTAPEPADLQGFFNAERVEQATRLMAFVDGIEADPTKGADVILLGDFNAYHEEDPSQVITAAGFADLVPDATDEYTYTFNGELGSLDHAFVSESLAAAVTGVDVWTINAPEWSDRGYAYGATESGTPFRSSDHDPVKVGFSSAPAPIAVDIVSVNDFHGRLEANGAVAGAAVMGGMVDSYRANNPNTLFVGAGDFIGASTFTSFIQDDIPTLDILNEIGLDTSAFGNHEFDQGRADVDDRILPYIDWDYLAANLYEKGTDEPAYQEYWVQDYGDVSVGFVGAVTDELSSLVSPAGIATLDVGPVVPAVNRVADQLSDGVDSNGEADVIILLVHEGAATTDIASSTDESSFGQIVTGANANIDAIISGHTHLAYDHEVPIPGTDRLRPVLSSGQYGEQYSHTALSIDPETGELLSISADVLPLAGFTPDPEVAAIVAEATEVATELGSVPLGEISADFNRGVQSSGSENRGAESTIGNFVADVQLWATQENGAEISVMNPGGLRADLKYAANPAQPGDAAGVVTYAEAAGVQPFANTLFTTELTGAQLKQVLEEQWQPAGASRPFLKLGVSSNLEYSYDPTAAAGSRITAVWIDGELIDPAASYTVAANSFLAAGGDNFATLAAGANPTDTGKVDLQSMVDYFEEFETAEPDYAQRSIGVTLSASDADGYTPGDEVTLNLSSLLLTRDGPREGTVTVSAGGTELGSAVIDPAIVDTTDEVGRASVTVTIPPGTPSGPLLLSIAVPASGSAIDVPIEVTSNAEPIVNEKAPKITGAAKVGRTLTVQPGRWSVRDASFAYQWNRDGVPIEGATGERYVVTAADAGAELTATVTASAQGYADGTATTAGKSVALLESRTTGAANRLFVFGNQPLNYTVTVRAAEGVEPTGEVAIYDGSRVLTTVMLEPGDGGRVTVPIEGLGRGVHLLTARYLGNEQVQPSRGFPSLVIKF